MCGMSCSMGLSYRSYRTEVTRGLGNCLHVDDESLDVVQSSGDDVVGRHCGHGRACPCRRVGRRCQIRLPSMEPNPQLEESVAWSGSCANGRAEGPGVAQWSKDGSPSETDQGEWRDGRQTGKGTQTWSSGRYEGELSDGEPNGHGVLTLHKLHYEGDFRNGKPNGLGTLTARSETVRGTWKMDVCRVRGRAQSAFPYQPVGDRRCNMVSQCAR